MKKIIIPASPGAQGQFPGRIALLIVWFLLFTSQILSQSIIGTVAGNGTVQFSGDGGSATSASLSSPYGVAVDGLGNLFIADRDHYRIRKVTPGGVISTVAGNGTSGFSGDAGPATSAQLSFPLDVAVDAAGNLFIADRDNYRIRKVNAAGIITTVAGNGTFGFSGDGGPATSARLTSPEGVAVDAAGNLFIADTGNVRIRKVTPDGVIGTVAGSGVAGYGGDNGLASSALLNYASGVAVDAAGNIYIADRDNARIRKVTPGGVITTVAGNGIYGFSGDGGSPTSAQLAAPFGVAVDAAGNIYIADRDNARIRKVTPGAIITTVAGNGTFGFSGDGGSPTSAQLSAPRRVAVDGQSNLFIADRDNNRIRKVTINLTVPTLTRLVPNFVVQGATVSVTLTGTSFSAPLSIDTGTGITVSDILLINETTATARFAIDPNAVLGERSVTVTTGLGTSGSSLFTVTEKFPDLSITSSHSGNFGAGFNGIYNIALSNVGTAATSGAITVTDNLPLGLAFVSGVGSGWSCSSSERLVTCEHPDSLGVGASTTLALSLAVASDAPSTVTHTPSVATAGDPISDNNSATDVSNVVATPTPSFRFTPTSLAVGKQATMGITLPVPFPFDVTGKVTLSFSPDAVIPVDDPAIQFATGGREVAFTIAANTLQPRFFTNSSIGTIGFQPGTVAGTLTFTGTLQAGTAQTTFSNKLTIPSQAPSIQKIQTTTQNGFAAVMTLLSSTREVTELVLQFNTNVVVRLSCGSAIGCTASGSTLTLDVRSVFNSWYAGDDAFGSLSTLRLPLSIPGSVHGAVTVKFQNRIGISNAVSFALP